MADGAVGRVGIVGTGVIGASWAAFFLARGFDVVATDPAPGADGRLRTFVDGAWPVLDYARRQGFDTRIGFEDTLTGPDGVWSATGNEELVRYAMGQAVSARLDDSGRRPRRSLLGGFLGRSRASHRG